MSAFPSGFNKTPIDTENCLNMGRTAGMWDVPGNQEAKDMVINCLNDVTNRDDTGIDGVAITVLPDGTSHVLADAMGAHRWIP